MTYDEVNAPSIDKPMSQAAYDLSTLQQILETSTLSLSCVERYQLNNIYNVGQWTVYTGKCTVVCKLSYTK